MPGPVSGWQHDGEDQEDAEPCGELIHWASTPFVLDHDSAILSNMNLRGCIFPLRWMGEPVSQNLISATAFRDEFVERIAHFRHGHRITPLSRRSARQRLVAPSLVAADWYRPSMMTAQLPIPSGSGTIGGTTSAGASHGTDGGCGSSVGRVEFRAHALRPRAETRASARHSLCRCLAIYDPDTFG